MWKNVWQSLILVGAVCIRILAMLLAFKYLSSLFGIEGFGLLSQAMAVGALFATISGGGLQTGLVRQVAAATTREDAAGWFKAAIAISLISAVFLSVLAVVLYLFFGGAVLGDDRYDWVFLIIAVVQLPLALGSTALAYLSGAGLPSAYSYSSIIGSIVAAVLVFLLSSFYAFSGAMAACILFAVWPALISVVQIVFRKVEEVRDALARPTERNKVYSLLRFGLYMFVAASAVPLALVHIRSFLGENLGWVTVGEWQSVARIGDAYIQVFGVIFINLMLPRLSALSEQRLQKQVVKQFALLTVGLFAIGATVFLLNSARILALVYTSAFVSASNYVLPQLVADFLKITASWFVYLHIARGRPVVQAVAEVVQAIVMALSFHLLVGPLNGLAAPWAYASGVAAVLLFLLWTWRNDSRTNSKFSGGNSQP